jgi:hypothetical protein
MVRYKFPHAEGGQPRFFEDLDATFSDTDKDGLLDAMEPPANLGSEIWTSWIRMPPGQKDALESYLRKVLDYYEGRLYYPANGIILPKNMGPETVSPGAARPGLDHFDLFMRPADYAYFLAHGGTVQPFGPHRRVTQEEAMGFYPGAIVTHLEGCFAGNISGPRRTSADNYLFGRSNAVLVLSNASTTWGRSPVRQIGWCKECINISPHFGVYYSCFVRLWGWTNWMSGCIMLGNPFVNAHLNLAAPSGTISGRLSPPPEGGPVEGFYVSATRDGKWYGRVMTEKDGSYELACLPPGAYGVKLHLNAFECMTRTVSAEPNKTATADWQLPKLWEVHGQVLDAQGKPTPTAWGWAEVAERNDPDEFVKNDLFGLRTDSEGRFALYGSKPLTFWIRACSGLRFVSESLQLSVKPGQKIEGQRLQIGLSNLARRLPKYEGTDVFPCEHKAEVEAPREEGLPALVDVTGLLAGLLPGKDRTLMRRGAPPKKYVQLGRAPYTLRFALELAETVPEIPPRGRLEYKLLIVTDPNRDIPADVSERRANADYALALSYDFFTGQWSAQPDLFGAHPKPAFWISHPLAIGRWIIVDVSPFKGNEKVDWRVVLSASYQPPDGERDTKRVPSTGCYRLCASLGEKPSLSLKYNEDEGDEE